MSAYEKIMTNWYRELIDKLNVLTEDYQQSIFDHYQYIPPPFNEDPKTIVNLPNTSDVCCYDSANSGYIWINQVAVAAFESNGKYARAEYFYNGHLAPASAANQNTQEELMSKLVEYIYNMHEHFRHLDPIIDPHDHEGVIGDSEDDDW